MTLDIRKRRQAEHASHDDVRVLASADLVFFTGGDQARLARILASTPVHHALISHVGRGGDLAGTSAGAAALAEVMHFSQRGTTATARGLGFVPWAYIDTHFSQRQRHARLLGLVYADPARLGIGLDEDTAAIVGDDELTVVGSGSVTVIDARPMLSDVRAGVHLNVLRGGDRWDLNIREGVEANRQTLVASRTRSDPLVPDYGAPRA
jgi:cyanophycinase